MLHSVWAVCFGSLVVYHLRVWQESPIAETLWISTSSCSLLRRPNCCWTLFVIPAKLPESFPLLQLFVTPTQQGPCAIILTPSSDSWLWKKGWWDQNNHHLRSIISHIPSLGSNTHNTVSWLCLNPKFALIFCMSGWYFVQFINCVLELWIHASGIFFFWIVNGYMMDSFIGWCGSILI